VTGPGPGGGPHVRIFGSAALAETMAGDLAPQGGAFVALGDVNGDGTPEVVAGGGPGGPPPLGVLRLGGAPAGGGVLPPTPAVPSGVRVASCDVDGDGRAEIITAPGPGGGPHVRVFAVEGITVREVASFFAYDPGFTGGVFVGCGDVDGDGLGKVITAPDAG